MAVQELTLTLETVTPLFLHGADPTARPELRPPAFRGILRYWFRAAAGGVIGDSNLSGLRALETAVFGDTHRSSSITIRLVSGRHGPASGSHPVLPHKADQGGRRPAFQAGQRFDLRVQQRPSFGDEAWRCACAAVQLALTCGGLGLRSRRGYGTVRIAASSESSVIPPFPSSLQGWIDHIERVTSEAVTSVRALAHALHVPEVPLAPGPTKYPCANELGVLRIAHIDGAAKAMDAVTEFMSRVPKHRALGGIGQRQASPLWVRPIAVEEGYCLLFTVLASVLRPDSSANYEWVRTFLDGFGAGNTLAVRGWNL